MAGSPFFLFLRRFLLLLVDWDGSCVQVDPVLAPAALDALRRLRPVNEWSTRDVYFGGVHAVGRGEAAGDPRRGGAAASALRAGRPLSGQLPGA